MTFFKRSDMLYDYRWTTGENDLKLKGEPDHSEFDPQEGCEVLYLINKFGQKHNAEVPVIGNKVEKMIKNGLPQSIRTHEHIMKWLEENWSHY